MAGIATRGLRARVLDDPTVGTWRYPLAGVLRVLAMDLGLFLLVQPAEDTATSRTSAGECVTRTGRSEPTPTLVAVGVGLVFLGLSLGIALRDVYRGRPRNTP